MSAMLLDQPASCKAARSGSDVPASDVSALNVADPLGHRELRYCPGLPYDQWDEEPVDMAPRGERLLTAAEERHYFRQMNLAYFTASQLRARIVAGDEASTAEMMRLIQRGDALRDQLLDAFRRLNQSIAGNFVNRHFSFEELVSEGEMTLLRAMSRFDPERGFRFSTYAMHAIRRRLLRYVRTQHRERQSAGAWNDDIVPRESGRWTLAYERQVIVASQAIEQALSALSPRERYVLRARFGWGREFEPRTLREVAAELSVSRERVRQLEVRALRKLRELMRDEV